MDLAFSLIAGVILAGAAGAMALRNLVHCALCAAASFAGLAAAFLALQAEFAGFAQLLVYVGAVAILIVIALLLTRNFEAGREALACRPWVLGLAIALSVVGAIVSALAGSSVAVRPSPPVPAVTVKDLGELLMTRYVVALEVLGLLLTAALIGAVIIALREDDLDQAPPPGGGKPEPPGEHELSPSPARWAPSPQPSASQRQHRVGERDGERGPIQGK